MLPRSEAASRRRRVRRALAALWEELCAAHKLSWSQRRLLRRMAADLGAPSPALLFFKPSLFSAYLTDKPQRLSPRRKAALKHIASQLFAGISEGGFEAPSALGDDGLPHRLPSEGLAMISLPGQKPPRPAKS